LETDSDLRIQAAKALGGIGPDAKAAVPNLVVALEDRHDQEAMCDALAKIGKPAVGVLNSALSDRSPSARLGAAIALGKIGPDARIAGIRLAFLSTKDRHPEIREAARIALKKIQ
jgi:HEAT repeat protein